jgi:regulator of ribosome biosynthesis
MPKVVKASDLVPSAFSGDADSSGGSRSDALEYDLRYLAAFDSRALDETKLASPEERDSFLDELAQQSAQLLIKHIFQLPVEKTDIGPVVTLPASTTRLPRSQHVPKEKALTRWQKFAQEKGIVKRKRSRMVWDEAAEEWRPRFGYKRANDDTGDWAVPVKDGDDPMADPWERRRMEKQKRVIQNKLNQIRNLERAQGGKGVPAGIPTQVTMQEGHVSGVTGQGKRKRAKPGGESKDTKAARLRAAQGATASMGKFDKRLEGEPAVRRRVKAGKLPNESAGVSASRDSKMLDKLLRGPQVSDTQAAAAFSGGGEFLTAQRGGGKRRGRK